MLRIASAVVGAAHIAGFSFYLFEEGRRINSLGWVVGALAILGGAIVIASAYTSRPTGRRGIIKLWVDLKRAEIQSRLDSIASQPRESGDP